ncbi:MAG TPA: tetratricopeptide repeat protein [Anaerolineae bacterium]|nr:tetratricopeptide repeat protein [Anaerolineae bacterium]
MADPAPHNKPAVIRTPDQRLRVFVSSTLQELADERDAAREAIARLRLAPVMFELGARPHPPRELYRAYLDQSHIFIGIYWQRYGWIAPGETISGLEDEYRLSGAKPKLIYIKKLPEPVEGSPAPDREPRLKELLDRIRNDDTASYKPFASAHELRELIENDLALLLTERFETSQADAAEPAPPRSNLPAPSTRFIGRESEMAEVKRLLSNTRLLTLTGAGGTGKTRLSLQVAADLLDSFADGVWLVELAPLSDPVLIPQSVATTLGVREVPGRPLMVALTDYLRAKHLLLILDNCEHLIDACAHLADHLLRACAHLKILASSREALGIAGEIAFRVPSLAVPPDVLSAARDLEGLTRCESAQLFVERTMAVQPHFAVTPQNAPAIAQICQRLDGIPLALELAAARVKVLSVEQIAARLNDRFRLLTGGSRAALPRQQTLRASIDWSYSLLPETEQTLFRRLAVFVGGWTLEAAESVCSDQLSVSSEPKPLTPDHSPLFTEDVLDLLTHLVDKSLVIKDERADEVRFHRLETIRQYARDKLLESGEAARARDRHLEFFFKFAQEAERDSGGAETLTWFNRLETEHDNLRAALEWALESNPDTAIELAVCLTGFWGRRGYATEGSKWLGEALARVEALPPPDSVAAHRRLVARAKALVYWGNMALYLGDPMLGRARFEEGVTLSRQTGDEWLIAIALQRLADAELFTGEPQDAKAAIEESVALFRKVGDRKGLAFALYLLARIAHMRGDRETSRASLEESTRLSRESDLPWESAMSLFGLGLTARSLGDYAEARARFRECLALFREMGDKHFTNVLRSELAETERLEGNYEEAVPLYNETILTWRDFGHRGGIARCLEVFAFIANARSQKQSSVESTGYLKRAARLLGAAEALRKISQSAMPSDEFVEYDRELSALEARLDRATFDAAWAEGRAMSMEQAIEYALETTDD